jgi:YegS/Rv2252/BmrU family lipid kinase
MTERGWKVIINPVSSGGRSGKLWPELEAILRQSGLVFCAELTERPWHAAEIARRALDEGFREFVVVGGDGTVHEAVNGLVVEGAIDPAVSLSIVPGGTGSDLVRFLGVSRDPLKAAQAVAASAVRRVDIGEIRCQRDGRPHTRYFVNVAGLGFDSEVCARVNRMSKRLSGTIPYLSSLVATLFSYRNKDVELEFDGHSISGRVNSVVVCNGQYFGGGMWIGPRASADDGLLDVVLLKDLNTLEFLYNVPRVYKGTHLTHPKVESFRTTEIHVQARQRMFIQAEGELVGEAPATFRVLSSALNLRV